MEIFSHQHQVVSSMLCSHKNQMQVVSSSRTNEILKQVETPTLGLKETAILQCIELYNKETKTIPKFRLTYGKKVWEFREHTRGSASHQARWYLDALVFGQGDVKWFDGIDKERIPYKWADE